MNNFLPDKAYWFDHRLYPMNHNSFANAVHIPENKKEWEERRDFVRTQLALSAGLIPAPDFPDLQPKIWDEADFADIVIKKVAFESFPGLACTGSLYEPKNINGKAPAILCPYGHWQEGRFNHTDDGSIPSRCIRFAQLGFVVFCYDMVGKCDNNQIMHRLPIDLLRTAELYGTPLFALQTWNSIRALDFICALPEVDENRIGCTGASGGASQTWTITALDDRIKVFAPVCMLSSTFQGGCSCEEGPMLRLNGLTSFDVIAACAPRPVILPSVTQDWTNQNPVYEVQALKKVYELLGAPQNIRNFHADAPHNYNLFTREHVYPWFVHFLMNQPLKNTIPEGAFEQPPIQLLRHTEPQIYPTPETSEKSLKIIQQCAVKDALGFTTDKKDFMEEKEEKLDLLSLVLNNDTELRDIAARVIFGHFETENATVWSRIFSRRDMGDVIPGFKATPLKTSAPDKAVLLLAPDGKASFIDNPERRTVFDAAIAQKAAVYAIDYLGTGETKAMLENAPRNSLLEDPEFYAFNPSVFSMRCQDVLTVLCAMAEEGFSKVTVIAVGEAARVAACAVPLADNVAQLVLDMKDVHDDEESWLKNENFQPLVFKLGAFKGILSLMAPAKLAICNADADILEHIKELYKMLGQSSALVIAPDLNGLLAKVL